MLAGLKAKVIGAGLLALIVAGAWAWHTITVGRLEAQVAGLERINAALETSNQTLVIQVAETEAQILEAEALRERLSAENAGLEAAIERARHADASQSCPVGGVILDALDSLRGGRP